MDGPTSLDGFVLSTSGCDFGLIVAAAGLDGFFMRQVMTRKKD